MKKILIPNATGPTNPGDQAILLGLLSFLNKNNLVIHSSENTLYTKKLATKIEPTLYSWAVLSTNSTYKRLFRVFQLILEYTQIKLKIKIIPVDPKLKSLLKDYEEADLIIFIGGGYLHTQEGFSQSLNLIMQLLIFHYAKLFHAKKIIAPISFGPFRYKWQEKITAAVLKEIDVITVREKISFNLLRSYDIQNLYQSVDHAFFLKREEKAQKTKKHFILGFTIRNWLPKEKQLQFEDAFANAIIEFARKINARIQPIVQVDAPKYGDTDMAITKKIVKKITDAGIPVMEIKKINEIPEAMGVYENVDLLLGMRMHSNILAAVHYTPFVAIAYEHKTKGIASDLNLVDYCIDVENVTQERLLQKLIKTYENRNNLSMKLKKSIETLRNKEKKYWETVIS